MVAYICLKMQEIMSPVNFFMSACNIIMSKMYFVDMILVIFIYWQRNTLLKLMKRCDSEWTVKCIIKNLQRIGNRTFMVN